MVHAINSRRHGGHSRDQDENETDYRIRLVAVVAISAGEFEREIATNVDRCVLSCGEISTRLKSDAEWLRENLRWCAPTRAEL